MKGKRGRGPGRGAPKGGAPRGGDPKRGRRGPRKGGKSAGEPGKGKPEAKKGGAPKVEKKKAPDKYKVGDTLAGLQLRQDKKDPTKFVAFTDDKVFIRVDWPETFTDEELKKPQDLEVLHVQKDRPSGEIRSLTAVVKGTKDAYNKHQEELKKPHAVGDIIEVTGLKQNDKHEGEAFALNHAGRPIRIVYPRNLTDEELSKPQKLEIISVDAASSKRGPVYEAVVQGHKDEYEEEKKLRAKELAYGVHNLLKDVELTPVTGTEGSDSAMYTADAEDGRKVIVTSRLKWDLRPDAGGVVRAPVRITEAKEGGLDYEGVIDQEWAVIGEANRLRAILGTYQEFIRTISERIEAEDGSLEYTVYVPEVAGRDVRRAFLDEHANVWQLLSKIGREEDTKKYGALVQELHQHLDKMEEGLEQIRGVLPELEIPEAPTQQLLDYSELEYAANEELRQQMEYREQIYAYVDNVRGSIKLLKKKETLVVPEDCPLIDDFGLSEGDTLDDGTKARLLDALIEEESELAKEIASWEQVETPEETEASLAELFKALNLHEEDDPTIAKEVIAGGELYRELQEKLAALRSPVKIKHDPRFIAQHEIYSFAEGMNVNIQPGDVITGLRVNDNMSIEFTTAGTAGGAHKRRCTIPYFTGIIKDRDGNVIERRPPEPAVERFIELVASGRLALDVPSMEDERFVDALNKAPLKDIIRFLNGDRPSSFDPLYNVRGLRDSDHELYENVRAMILDRVKAMFEMPDELRDQMELTFGRQDYENRETFTFQIVVGSLLNESFDMTGNEKEDKEQIEFLQLMAEDALKQQKERELAELDERVGVLPEMKAGMRGAVIEKGLVATALGLAEEQLGAGGAFVLKQDPDGNFAFHVGEHAAGISAEQFLALQRNAAIRVLETPLMSTEESEKISRILERVSREAGITPPLSPGETFIYHGPDQGDILSEGSRIVLHRYFKEGEKAGLGVWVDDDALNQRTGTVGRELGLDIPRFLQWLNASDGPRLSRLLDVMPEDGVDLDWFKAQLDTGREVSGVSLLKQLDLYSDEAPDSYLCRIQLAMGTRREAGEDLSSGSLLRIKRADDLEGVVYVVQEEPDGSEGAMFKIPYKYLIERRNAVKRMEGETAVEPPKFGKEKLAQDLQNLGVANIETLLTTDSPRQWMKIVVPGAAPRGEGAAQRTRYMFLKTIDDKIIEYTVPGDIRRKRLTHQELMQQIHAGMIKLPVGEAPIPDTAGPAPADVPLEAPLTGIPEILGEGSSEEEEAPAARRAAEPETIRLDEAGAGRGAASAGTAEPEEATITPETDADAFPEVEQAAPARTIEAVLDSLTPERLEEIQEEVQGKLDFVSKIILGPYLLREMEKLQKKEEDLREITRVIRESKERFQVVASRLARRGDRISDFIVHYNAVIGDEQALAAELASEIDALPETASNGKTARELFGKTIPQMWQVAENIKNAYVGIIEEMEEQYRNPAPPDTGAGGERLAGGPAAGEPAGESAGAETAGAETEAGPLDRDAFIRKLSHELGSPTEQVGNHLLWNRFVVFSGDRVLPGRLGFAEGMKKVTIGEIGDFHTVASPEEILAAIESGAYTIRTRDEANAFLEKHAPGYISRETFLEELAGRIPADSPSGLGSDLVFGRVTLTTSDGHQLESIGLDWSIGTIRFYIDGQYVRTGYRDFLDAMDRGEYIYSGPSQGAEATGEISLDEEPQTRDAMGDSVEGGGLNDAWAARLTGQEAQLMEEIRAKGITPEDFSQNLVDRSGQRIIADLDPTGAGIMVAPASKEGAEDEPMLDYRLLSPRDFLLGIRTGDYIVSKGDSAAFFEPPEFFDFSEQWKAMQPDAVVKGLERIQREYGIYLDDLADGLEISDGRLISVTPGADEVFIAIGENEVQTTSVADFMTRIIGGAYIKRGSAAETYSESPEDDTQELPPVDPERVRFLDRLRQFGIESEDDLFYRILDTTVPDTDAFLPMPRYTINWGDAPNTLIMRSADPSTPERTVTFDEFIEIMRDGEQAQFTQS